MKHTGRIVLKMSRFALNALAILLGFRLVFICGSKSTEEEGLEGAYNPLSVNIVDLFWKYINTSFGGQEQAVKAMKDAHSSGFDYFRFAASAFWPDKLQLWFNMTTRKTYWEAFSLLLKDATNIGVHLIPSLVWNHFAFCDVCHEPLSQYFSPTSCTQKAVKNFTVELVTLVKDSPAILFLELGNEFNLLADLDMSGRGHVAPSRGTPSARTKADNFTTDQMIDFCRNMTSWIKEIMPGVKVSSGHSIPRASAEHLRQSYHKPQEDWRNDTLEEFKQNLKDVSQPVDIISVHLYSKGGDNVRFNITDPLSADLLRLVKGVADESGKVMYLGEYGDPLPGKRQYTHNVLEVIVEAQIQYSTLWVWEFYQLSPTVPANFSLIPGRDDVIVHCMEDANKNFKNKTMHWKCMDSVV